MKETICLLTYWLLFIILPCGIALSFLPSDWRVASAIPIALIIILVGEHGFRKWKRVWKVD